MKRAVLLVALAAIVLAFMGRPGPPPRTGPHGFGCVACHPPYPLTDVARVYAQVDVKGYVVDQRPGFLVVASGQNAYHVRVRALCPNLVGYKVEIKGIEVRMGKGVGLTWRLVQALSCPSKVPALGVRTESPPPLRLEVVNRPECSSCHPKLLLAEWTKLEEPVKAKVYVFVVKNGTAIGSGENAFWHLVNCKVETGTSVVEGTLVEKGSGLARYYVIKCS